MPPESRDPGSASDWLRRARSDLAVARAPLPVDALYEDLCFHAQAAEKAIKAVYRAANREFRYTRDLSELIHGLESFGITAPEGVRELKLCPVAASSTAICTTNCYFIWKPASRVRRVAQPLLTVLRSSQTPSRTGKSACATPKDFELRKCAARGHAAYRRAWTNGRRNGWGGIALASTRTYQPTIRG